jgi:hypothetical protein
VAAQDDATVLTRVRLITMTANEPLAGKAVVVARGKIREILDEALASRLAGATIVNGGGRMALDATGSKSGCSASESSTPSSTS